MQNPSFPVSAQTQTDVAEPPHVAKITNPTTLITGIVQIIGRTAPMYLYQVTRTLLVFALSKPFLNNKRSCFVKWSSYTTNQGFFILLPSRQHFMRTVVQIEFRM